MTDTSSEFTAAVGLSAPLQVEYTHRGRGPTRRVQVSTPYAILGRHTKCQVLLSDTSVSRRHAYAQVLDGFVYVLDCNSRRGLRVGDSYVSQGWLRPGQSLQVGDFDVQFFPDPPASTARPPERGHGLPLALAAPNAPAFPLRGPITIVGRDPSAHLRIEDDRLDPFHAAVVRAEATSWVVSLFGAGGVKINGRPTWSDQVKTGDRLLLNNVEVRVQDAPPSEFVLATAKADGMGVEVVRELGAVLANLFAAHQQEQIELLKRQNDLLQVIADACRRGALPLPGAAATPLPPPASNTPAPQAQPLLPREAETLSEAHGWLMDRLLASRPKPPT